MTDASLRRRERDARRGETDTRTAGSRRTTMRGRPRRSSAEACRPRVDDNAGAGGFVTWIVPRAAPTSSIRAGDAVSAAGGRCGDHRPITVNVTVDV